MSVPKYKIDAVIFDLDGTLLDTEALSDKAMLAVLEPWLDETVKEECQADSHRLPWALKKQILGLRGAEWAPIVLNYAAMHWNIVDKISPEKLWSEWERQLNLLCHEVEACPGAMNLVKSFAKESLPMGIATSSRKDSVTKKSTRHGEMFGKISVIVTGDHPAVIHGKPAPDIYLEAARQLTIENTRKCLVFEDALSGVRSGKAAGCIVVAVPDPRFSPEEKELFRTEADIVLDSLQDFSWDLLKDKIQ